MEFLAGLILCGIIAWIAFRHEDSTDAGSYGSE